MGFFYFFCLFTSSRRRIFDAIRAFVNVLKTGENPQGEQPQPPPEMIILSADGPQSVVVHGGLDQPVKQQQSPAGHQSNASSTPNMMLASSKQRSQK